MPIAYNPDEFARAKHLVALADAINTKINTVSTRTSRPVSLTCRFGDGFTQLDATTSTLSIPFKGSTAITAILRITSCDEDVVPTFTLSNNVTASTPTYSNGYFETTLTLPSASVTSFSMTIALPQTEQFSAWQKTFTVNANIKIARTYSSISNLSNGNTPYTVNGNKSTLNLPINKIQASGSERYFWFYMLSETFDISPVHPVVTNNALTLVNNNQNFPLGRLGRVGVSVGTYINQINVGDVITFTVTLPETDMYQDESYDVAITITAEE